MDDERELLLPRHRNSHYGDDKTPEPQPSSDTTTAAEPLRVRRTIDFFSGVMLICGVMIGCGIFVTPNMILRVCNNSVGISLIIWIGGGIVATLSTLCYSELAVSIPESGSDYSYLNHAYGPPIAFLMPWMSCFLPTSNAVDALAFAQYAIQPVFPNDTAPQNAVKLLASCMVLLVTAINAYSVRLAVRVQTTATLAKFLAIGFVVGGGLYYSAKDPSVATDTFENAFDPGPIEGITFGTITTAFYQVMWTYQGWNALCHVTEEVERPRTVAMASMLAVFIITICFVVINVAFLLVLTPTEMSSSSAVALTFADKLLGNASWVISLMICVVAFGSFNSSVLTMARVSYVAARNGHLPRMLGMLHIHKVSPLPAIYFNALPVLVLVWIGEFETLIDAFGFISWIFFALSSASVLVLRYRKPELPRPFKIPTIVPIVTTFISICFVFIPVISNPHFLYFYALAFFAVGVLVFYIFVHRNVSLPGIEPATKFCQNLLQVAPEDLD